MDPLYLRKLRIDRQIQQQIKNLKSEEKPNSASAAQTSGAASEEAVKAPEHMKQQANELVKNIRDEVLTPRRQPKYNYIASMERSDYVKKMMNLPRTLPELLIQLQRPNYNKGVYNVLNQQIPQPDIMQDGVLGTRPENSRPQENPVLKPEGNQPQQRPQPPVLQPDGKPMPLPDNRPVVPMHPQPQIPTQPQQPIQPQVPQLPQVPSTPLQPSIPSQPVQPQPLPPQQPIRPQIPQLPQVPSTPLQPSIPSQPVQPQPPHNPLLPPMHEPMPLPPHRPIPPQQLPPNKDVIPPHTEYLDGNVEMYVPRHPHHHRLHGPEPNLPPVRPELRPEPPKKPPVEPTVSEQVGAVKDSTIDDAQAALYAQLSMNDITNPTLTQMRQRLSGDAFELLFTGMLNLNDLSETIKHSGKDARAKLILAMANASKQGFDNSQISGSLKMVSESMALEENNPTSILKNIILLYLPWYPLQEGVGFKLAIETMPNVSDFSSLLKVFIQTRNYGNVNGSLILMNANNVDMQIQCDDKFPKDDLLERMKDVTENHTMQSNITVEQRAQMAQDVENQQAKVNLSSTYDLNPFLLLMAHSFIKNTIIIDGAANA